MSLISYFPSWFVGKDRRLLRSTLNAINIDVVVANDGRAKYKTIKEIIIATPTDSKTRNVMILFLLVASKSLPNNSYKKRKIY